MKTKYRMTMFFILFSLSLSAVPSVFAQTPESFFPHHIGDRWDYVYFNGGFRGPSFLTRDSVGMDGSHNLFYNGLTDPNYRIDTALSIFRDPQRVGLNYLRYKLAADSGQVWENPQSPMLRWAWVARVESASVFGTPTVIKVFRYAPGNPGGQGSLEEDWLASGFGLIYAYREPNEIDYLRGCVIAGDTFGLVTSVKFTFTDIPSDFVLEQNYPNPFNSSTIISFRLPRQGYVSIRVFNVLGELTATIFDGRLEEGKHQIGWNPADVSSGTYFCRMQANGNIRTIKMLLTK